MKRFLTSPLVLLVPALVSLAAPDGGSPDVEDVLQGSVRIVPNQTTCDVNGDGKVDVVDLNAVLNCILGIGQSQEYEYVDLGLPSGTLWATMNVGANSPEDYGSYFAWGETTPKHNYDWSTYKWCNDDGDFTKLTKYNWSSGYGTVDNKTELDPEDDAAYVNWGPEWRMPSDVQIDELRVECTWEWTSMNGMNGYLVTSKRNANALFLPVGGLRDGSSLDYAGDTGRYWSRSHDPDRPYNALGLGIIPYDRGRIESGYRRYGWSVRAVRVSRN